MIKPKGLYGYFANLGDADDPQPIQLEMLMPFVGTRIVKPGKQARRLGNGANIASFRTIARRTSIGEITHVCPTTMLLANDMVNMTAKASIFFVDETVLAQVLCPLRNNAATFR